MRLRLLAVSFVIAAIATAAHAAPTPITLAVDAREAPRRLLHVRETIPAAPGELALAYPEWLPGEHAPTGQVIEVFGLLIDSGGRRIAWRRDDVDPFTLRCTVPPGASAVQLTFDYALATTTSGYSTAACATENLVMLCWNQVVFAPARLPADAIPVRASVTLPAGWRHATALHATSETPGQAVFEPVPLERLVDSPLLAGRYFRRVDLAPGSPRPCTLDLACDAAAGLAISDSAIAAHRRLVREARALFGGTHYDEYHFLMSLSDHVAHFGLEHHECSDDRAAERTWIDDGPRVEASTLLSHEYVHSWNGKYRRPLGLVTPDFSRPMRDSLLWVYEGLTQYLGWLLGGRSGIRTFEQSAEDLARTAALMENSRGREWRPLLDTAVEAAKLYDARLQWSNARRSVDFYEEGLLIWLEADVTIRRLTRGARSLDDFCRAFLGGEGHPAVKPYDQAEVVRTLDAVAPYDWAAFLQERIERVQPHAPLGGITGAGWAVAWRDTAGEVYRAHESGAEQLNEDGSIGLELEEKTGNVVDIVPGAPADRAGVAPGMTLLAVNGRRWSKDVLHDAIRATREGGPLELLFENNEFFRTARLDYRGGLRYPALARAPGTPDLLTAILAPHAAP